MTRFLNKKREKSNRKIKLDETTPFYTVFYLEQGGINTTGEIPEMRLDLKTKIIPGELANLYIETYGNGLAMITTEEIEKFIQDNIRR